MVTFIKLSLSFIHSFIHSCIPSCTRSHYAHCVALTHLELTEDWTGLREEIFCLCLGKVRHPTLAATHYSLKLAWWCMPTDPAHRKQWPS